MERTLSKDGSVHMTDEVWNTVISASGAFLSLIGVIFLIGRAHATGSLINTLAFAVYGLSLINMFVSSALHHGVNGSDLTNHRLRQYDYYSISVMIAGSFTPFCIIILEKPLGWIVLGVIWTLAFLGIAIKAIFPKVPRWFMTSLFIGMGWMAVLVIKPLYHAIHWQGFFFMLLGGLFFTVGGLIYYLEKPNPFPGKFGFHEIWHCFVLAGAASHFFLMYFYI